MKNFTVLFNLFFIIIAVPLAENFFSLTMTIEKMTEPLTHLQIGGRKSTLAVAQSNIVKQMILEKFPNLEIDVLALSTLGDQVLLKPLYSFGGKSLWTKELEILLLEAVDQYPKLDLIVHSLKDMPTNLPEEFELGAVLTREDPRDALVMKAGLPYKCLGDLPDGSIVGTSSVRRSAQLMKNYPNLKFESVRGNVQTRFKKLDDPNGIYSCLILANAGLVRLGLGDRVTCLLNDDEMYYAVGQGALGIEIRSNDTAIKNIISSIEHMPTTYCCLAERSLMRYLEGGCSVPIGVHSSYNDANDEITLKGIIVSPDGKEFIEDVATGIVHNKNDAEKIGIALGDKLLAKGAREILDKIDYEKINQKPTAERPQEPVKNSPIANIAFNSPELVHLESAA